MNETDKLKVPPHSAEAERGVLGAILLDADAGYETRVLDLCLARGMTQDTFFDPRHRLLFTTFCEMSRAAKPLDAVTLLEELRLKGRLDTVGGAMAIQAIVDATPSSAHAEYYIDILTRKHLVRKLIARANETLTMCYDEARAADADTLLGEVEKGFLEIGGDATDNVRWKDAVQKTLLSIENIFDKGAGAMEGLPTGFKYIDEKLLGLKPAEMIVIAARPSVGKTSFAMNIAECVALGKDIDNNPFQTDETPRQHPVLIFSLEMDASSLAKRMLCGRAHVSSWRVARNLMPLSEKREASERLFAAAQDIGNAPIFIDDASGLDISDLRARARRMKRRYGIELIVIDYLQLCNCREVAKQGRQIETSRISGQIKAMAKELKIPVIVLSQLSRANEQRGDKNEVPKLSDLRDSGAIEQDADVVMLLRRPAMIQATKNDAELQNIAHVDIAKHRNGEVGDVKMTFLRDFTRFGNRNPNEERAAAEEAEAARESGSEEVIEPPEPTIAQIAFEQPPLL